MLKVVLGFILLGIVVFIWVGSSTLLQQIQNDFNYQRPAFLVYFSTMIFNIYFLDILRRRKDIKEKKIPSLKENIKASILLFPLWFFANFFFNCALINTSVASVTILSCTSGVITFLLSLCLLKSSPELLKFLATIFALIGIGLVASVNAEYKESSIAGNILALVSASLYSLYCIILSKKSEKIHIPHTYAFVGLLDIVIGTPIILIFNYTDVEVFSIPSLMILGFLAANAVISTMISELIWAYSIKLLNPTICTFGTSLTIPISLVLEHLLYGYTYADLYIVGTVFIILSFILMSVFEHPVYGPLISNRNLFKICKKNRQERRLSGTYILMSETNSKETK